MTFHLRPLPYLCIKGLSYQGFVGRILIDLLVMLDAHSQRFVDNAESNGICHLHSVQDLQNGISELCSFPFNDFPASHLATSRGSEQAPDKASAFTKDGTSVHEMHVLTLPEHCWILQ